MVREYHIDGWIASWYIWDDSNAALEVYNSIFDDNQVSGQLVQELIDQTRQWPQDGILVFGFRPLTTQQIITLENQLSGFNEAAV